MRYVMPPPVVNALVRNVELLNALHITTVLCLTHGCRVTTTWHFNLLSNCVRSKGGRNTVRTYWKCCKHLHNVRAQEFGILSYKGHLLRR